MFIELAKKIDTPTLCALFNEARSENSSFPETAFDLTEFLKIVEGEKILVARMNGEIAGFASVWVRDTFLHHLYVLPRFQRQGIGGELLQKSVSLFGLPMSLKCLESNADACRFYEKMGWRPSETAESQEGRYVLYIRE